MPAHLLHTSLERGLLLVQILSTLAMLGLIWFVQLVHYPLFFRIAPERFKAYEAEHANRTGWIAGPLMVAELLTAACLLRSSLRPHGIPAPSAWLGLGLVSILWASILWVQIPLHNRLHRGYDHATIQRLVTTNWLRTVVWTARAALVLWWVNRLWPPR